MLIDEVRFNMENLRFTVSDPDLDEYVLGQLKLLDDECPIYDIHNVHRILKPDFLAPYHPNSAMRNATLAERRQKLIEIAMKAPLGPPWMRFYCELRRSELREGILVRWDDKNRVFIGTIITECLDADKLDIQWDIFRIYLDDDDHVARREVTTDSPEATRINIYLMELVQICVGLLNWDRDDVPTEVRPDAIKKENTKKTGKGPAQSKTSPTIIKFELFLNQVLSGTHRLCSAAPRSSSLHLVRGHYKNFRYEAPMFGHAPVLGRTYGRIWVKPHQSGCSASGKPKAPNAVIKIGEQCA